MQIVTREDEDALYMFLWNYENNGGEDDICETDIVLDGLYIPYVLDAWSGEISAVPVYSIEDGKTLVPVSVTYHDAAIYIFKASDSEAPHLVAGGDAEIVAKVGYNLNFYNSHGGPIFVTAGDRSRTPVTGKSKNNSYGGTDKERIGNSIFVLPNTDHYAKYPIRRYQPAYGRISGSASTPIHRKSTLK